jgi:hypothetical protein
MGAGVKAVKVGFNPNPEPLTRTPNPKPQTPNPNPTPAPAPTLTLQVGSNPEFPDTKCFVIERIDGSVVDFSYIKCVTNLYPEAASEGGKGGKGGGQRNQP